ncbi:hypothetical protein [Paenibacillus amylolyticus]|uniref:Uncharacterized protein n=1 Tax=Paenibacillus amylolyticus TaxID=1451 RepID=A0A117I3P1_PAEAM|nr:hypothetical protein [Paenibacillus amylolyticus]GAS85655.1 unknown protein [Paenibacillus amylolyticus]
MRPLILADWIKADGIAQLLHIQLYDRRGELHTSSIAPCTDPVLAIQLALEVVEFAEIGGGFDLQTSDREIFKVALEDPEIAAYIVHPLDMAQLTRIVKESPDVYRELFPSESPSVEAPVIPELTGWCGRFVRWLKRIIQIIEKGEMTND